MSGKIHFGVYELDRDAMELRKHCVLIRLQEQPLRVLATLVERPGEIVTRAELQEQIWGKDTFVDFEQSLNKAVNRVREALHDDAGRPQYVETIPRRGYRFVAPITGIEAHASVARPPQHLKQDTESASTAPLASLASQKNGLTRSKIFVVAMVIAILVGTALYFAFPSGRVIDSIAVLPLANAASDPKSDYLSEGITDGLIDGLSQLPNLTVKSERSVAHYKGRDVDPRIVGRELGVRAVLVGKLVPHGDSISIIVELVDARNDNHIWGDEQGCGGELSDRLLNGWLGCSGPLHGNRIGRHRHQHV